MFQVLSKYRVHEDWMTIIQKMYNKCTIRIKLSKDKVRDILYSNRVQKPEFRYFPDSKNKGRLIRQLTKLKGHVFHTGNFLYINDGVFLTDIIEEEETLQPPQSIQTPNVTLDLQTKNQKLRETITSASQNLSSTWAHTSPWISAMNLKYKPESQKWMTKWEWSKMSSCARMLIIESNVGSTLADCRTLYCGELHHGASQIRP